MLQWPTELLLEIGAHIDGLSDLLHFGLTCRGLSSFFLDELYSRDVRDGHCWALQWACRTGNLALAKRSLDAGAPVDHQFFDPSMANWAPWPFSEKRMRAACLAGTPLSVAVQHRHVDLVRFLLEEKGANPNQGDKWAASYHGQIWYPIHWAVAVRLLLRHGADANQRTFAGPRRCPGDEASIVHWDRLRPLHLTGCDHVPVAILELLLDAGADHRSTSAFWGCSRAHSRVPWLFEYLSPLWPYVNATREAKLLLAARRGGEDRQIADAAVLDGERGERAGGAGVGGVSDAGGLVAAEGGYAGGGGGEDPGSEGAARRVETLGLLETLIARLVGVSRILYADEAVQIDRERERESGESPSESAAAAPQQNGGGLAQAFRSFCANAKDSSDASPFVAVLAEHGVLREREGRQLTISETVERRLVPKYRSLLQEWPRNLVLGSHSDYGMYRRDVDSAGAVRFHRIGTDEEAHEEAERRWT
ncbi:ankyrin 2-3/unc44 [Apiospora aurea]|uniref:protein S-acyltransferase n=1 Tax=Apiospora aurea TaxID=335848 RepID=A0ABR1QHU1_9PEZI